MIKTIKKTIGVIFLLFLTSCLAQNEFKSEIKFTIVNNSIKDNTFVTLLISNNSKFNYFLPILNTLDSEKWKFMSSADENNFFFIYPVVYNFKDKQMEWHSNTCYNDDFSDEELKKLNEKWVIKKKHFGIDDLILLKAGEQKKIKIPINLRIKFSKYCFWEIDNYKNEKDLQLTYYYQEKKAELMEKFLDSKTREKLNKMNFKLYSKEIESNKAILKL